MRLLIPLLLLGIVLNACHSQQKLVKAERARLNNKSPKQLTKLVKSTDFDFEWLSLRAAARLESPKENQSFKIKLRMRKDSAIWMSVVALGVEVSRVLITTDSLKMLDRLNGKYYTGDFIFLSDRLQTDLDFQTLQALLLGNSMLWDENAKRKSSLDSTAYVLHQYSRRRQRRKNADLNAPVADLFYTFWIEPSLNKVVKLSVKDPLQNKSLVAEFASFDKEGKFLLPKKQNFRVTGDEPMLLKLEYTKVVVNEPQSLPFKVSHKYERIAQ